MRRQWPTKGCDVPEVEEQGGDFSLTYIKCYYKFIAVHVVLSWCRLNR